MKLVNAGSLIEIQKFDPQYINGSLREEENISILDKPLDL